MKYPKAIDAPTILALLAEKHSNDVFVPECKSGPTQGASGHDRLDAWVMPRSWAHPAVTGYEIKVSRADFLRDQKWTRYLDLCNLMYFVAPKGVIQIEELPAEVGLIEVTLGGRRLLTRRKAAPRNVTIPEDVWRYVLMCRTKIVDEFGSKLGRGEFWRLWLAEREANRTLGYEIKGKIRELYRENVERRPCKACGMTIEIRPGPNGKPIPLQRVRSFYALEDPLHGGSIRKLDLAAGIEAGFVSHFETCPNAGQFSGSRKR